ncbi:hypothetical protein R3P38DRAFT_2806586 [Favolaschia claudopus]|uniref:Uncharacterized protein n=1 Tax=Favolaschia claudopus TaxID=2862362 RepID=A0AAV9ZJL7_9AGAR
MLLIGALVSAALYGGSIHPSAIIVGCLQAWHYYQKFKGDSALLKALVAKNAFSAARRLIVVLRLRLLLSSILASKHWSQPWPFSFCGKRTLDIISVSSFLNPARTALIIVGAFATEIGGRFAPRVPTRSDLNVALSMSCNITSAAADTLITTALTYYLYIVKSSAGFPETHEMINRLVNIPPSISFETYTKADRINTGMLSIYVFLQHFAQ